jgi:ribonuclease HI
MTEPAPGSNLESKPLPEGKLAPEVELVETSLVVPEPDDTLFALDDALDETEWHTIELQLTAEELQRLTQRARDVGTTPDEFLRGLI